MKHLITLGLLTFPLPLAFACGGESNSPVDDDGTPGPSTGGMDSGSGGGSSSSGGSEMTGGTASTNGNLCNPSVPSSGEADCPGYITCAQTNCGESYRQCFGPNHASGDFAGSPCAATAECSKECEIDGACDETCAQACQDESCRTCFVDVVGSCLANNCASLLLACDLGGGGDFGTCADLQICCSSLSGDEQANCQAIYDGTSPAGDLACGTALQLYTATGQCSP